MWRRRKKEDAAQRRFEEMLVNEIHRLDAEVDKLKDLNRREHDRVISYTDLIGKLVEPPNVEDCTKIRLRDLDEANAFARKVEQDTGQAIGDLEAYGCNLCPRQPLTGRKFLHVRHRDSKKRGKWKPTLPKPKGSRIESRITPAVMTRLGYTKHREG